MTPLPPQPPKKKRSANAMPIPTGNTRNERASAKLPAPVPPSPKNSDRDRREESYADQNDVFEDNRIEGEDASFEMVDIDEQEALDESGEEEFLRDEESSESVEKAPKPVKPVSPPNPREKRVHNSPSSRKRRSSVVAENRVRETKKPQKNKNSTSNDDLGGILDPIESYSPRPNFVDEEALELKPYGRKKNDAYVKHIDNRQNLRKKAVYVQGIALGLAGLAAIFGFKNAVFPPPTLSDQEVYDIVWSETGNTGFPSQRGEGFAQDFVGVWAERGTNNVIRNASLAYFYGEEDTTGTTESFGDETLLTEGSFRQEVIYGPTVYESIPLTAYSERYVIGVGLSVSNTTTGVLAERDGEANIQWRYFSVDVFYNPDTDTMSIVPGSPTLLPPYNIGSMADVPLRMAPNAAAEVNSAGSADAELTESARTTIEGFFLGYADASQENTAPIDQYISLYDDTDSGILTHGMNGEFSLYGETASEAITDLNVYAMDNDGHTANALVTVSWQETVEASNDTDSFNEDISNSSESASVIYESTYILAMTQETEGRWVIYAMQPSNYIPAEIEE